MKTTILIILLFFLTTSLGFSKVVDYIVAVVNAEPITLSMAEHEMKAVWVDPSLRPKTIMDAIQKLIDHKLKLQEARRRGIFVNEDELLAEFSSVSSKFESPEKMSDALDNMGMTLDSLKERLSEDIMIQKMIERKFGQFIRDSDLEGEATNYFEQHKPEFTMPESVLLDRVLFNFELDSNEIAKADIMEKANEVLNDLINGASFSKYSNDENIGYTNVDDLEPSIAEVVKKMNVGDISGIIETSEGYFIVKLNDRRMSRQATFAEVKTQIISQLRQKKIDDDLQADLKKQRENSDIRINYREEQQQERVD